MLVIRTTLGGIRDNDAGWERTGMFMISSWGSREDLAAVRNVGAAALSAAHADGRALFFFSVLCTVVGGGRDGAGSCMR